MLDWMEPPSGWALGRFEWRPGAAIPDPLPYWGERPWYLEELPPEMEQMFASFGFARTRREELTPGLRRMLSAKACQRLVRVPWGRQVLAGLYQPFIPYVLPLLELGSDLVAAQPWLDRKLIGRLLQQAEHRGASVELAVWAALAQSGGPYTFEREPRGRDDRRPDFHVRADSGGEWFLEVKAANQSGADERAAEFEWSLFACVTDLQDEHRSVTVEGTALLRSVFLDESRCGELPDVQARALAGLESCARELRSRGLPPGEHNVADVLVVRIEESDEPFVQFNVWEGLPPQKDALRLVRLVRDAALQVPATSRAIVLLDVGAFKRLDVFAAEMNRVLREEAESARYDPIRAVLLFAYQHDSYGRLVRVPLQPVLAGRELSPVELELCARLSRRSAALPT